MNNIEALCNFLFTVLRMATPLIYGALAVCITRQAGLRNMAVESMMLSSALCGVIVSGYLNSLGLGLLGGILGGIAISIVISYAAFICKTDLWMTCIAMNTALVGGTILVMYLLTGQKTNTLGHILSKAMDSWEIPLLKNIPVIGAVFSGQNGFTYIAFFLIFVEWFFLFRTTVGLRIRAIGQNPQAAASVGISINKMYFLSFGISGFFAALGGMFMSMGYLKWFARDMIAGRGYISMSAANIADGMPLGAALVAILFGLSDAVGNYGQATNKMPGEFAYMFPYVATIMLLVVMNLYKKARDNRKRKQRIEDAHRREDFGKGAFFQGSDGDSAGYE